MFWWKGFENLFIQFISKNFDNQSRVELIVSNGTFWIRKISLDENLSETIELLSIVKFSDFWWFLRAKRTILVSHDINSILNSCSGMNQNFGIDETLGTNYDFILNLGKRSDKCTFFDLDVIANDCTNVDGHIGINYRASSNLSLVVDKSSRSNWKLEQTT